MHYALALAKAGDAAGAHTELAKLVFAGHTLSDEARALMKK